jgi:hypothetical protein
MGKAKVAILVGVILMACFATTIAILPEPTRPKLSIKVVGWTNNPAGVQFGVISVSNSGIAKMCAYALKRWAIIAMSLRDTWSLASMSLGDMNPGWDSGWRASSV